MKAEINHEKYRGNFKSLDDTVMMGYEHVSAVTGIPLSSLYTMKSHGELPTPVIERNRLVRWTAGQIRAWINELLLVAAQRQDDLLGSVPRLGRPRLPAEIGGV